MDGITVEGEVVRFGRHKKLGLQPEFFDDRVVLHPIPDSMQDRYREGMVAKGKFGRLHNSKRTDANGCEIFVQYFIPEDFIREDNRHGTMADG